MGVCINITNLEYAVKLAKELKLDISPEEIQAKRWSVDGLNILSKQIEEWRIKKKFRTDKANFAEKIALAHSELSEALEADRKGDEEETLFEIADAFIRLFDLVASANLDIEQAINFKMNINDKRPERHRKKY